MFVVRLKESKVISPDDDKWVEEAYPVVFYEPERVFARLVKSGAFYSVIQYTKDDTEIEETVDNGDIS